MQVSGCPEGDECLTPRYAVEPVVKYLKRKGYKKIWCPFDKENSQFVIILKREGFEVFHSHIDDKRDFFKLSKTVFKKCFNRYYLGGLFVHGKIDCIVSNPPFSKKTEILKELYRINVPFMMLFPLNVFDSDERLELFDQHNNDYQLLMFKHRINYYTKGNVSSFPQGNKFRSLYFCRKVLPRKRIIESLKQVQEHYNQTNIFDFLKK